MATGQRDAATEIPIYEADARVILFCLAAKANPEAAQTVMAGLDPALATLMRERMKVDTSSPGEDVAAIKKLLPLRRQDEDAMRAFVEVCREQERERKAQRLLIEKPSRTT